MFMACPNSKTIKGYKIFCNSIFNFKQSDGIMYKIENIRYNYCKKMIISDEILIKIKNI